KAKQFILIGLNGPMWKTHCLSLYLCPTDVRKVEHEGLDSLRKNADKSLYVPALVLSNPCRVGAVFSSAEKNRDLQGTSVSNLPLFSNCFWYSLRNRWMVSASSGVLSSRNFAILANRNANPDLYRGLF